MSTLEMQESMSDDEFTRSRGRASDEEQMMDKEEALDTLHQLHAGSKSSSSSQGADEDATVEGLRIALAGQEAALANAREYATELQQMYRDTLSACEAAEARVRDLEQQHANHKENETPLIIVSPPTSPSPDAPFLAQPQPATPMSGQDEAVVARLLNAIERLRSERDALRRDLHFSQVEHRVTIDVLQTRLAATEREAHKTVTSSQTREEAQLKVLEQRVLRRTEQIGMQQHDIKRLEMNLRVAEDTIGELNAEVETLAQEKECLIEDCAQARKARDGAHSRVETLEIEIETLAKQHDELVELRATFAQAGKARDEVQRRVEASEVETKTLAVEQQELLELRTALRYAEAEAITSEGRIEALVHVVADSLARSRALNVDLIHAKNHLSTYKVALQDARSSHSNVHVEVGRLTSELESKVLMLHAKTADVEAISHELSLAKDEVGRLSGAFESYKQDVQSREDVFGKTDILTATVHELEARLANAKVSENAFSEELICFKHAETALKAQLKKAQEDSVAAAAETDMLLMTVKSLEEAIESDRLNHSKKLEQTQEHFEVRLLELEAQLEENRIQQVTLETNHLQVVQDFIAKTEGLERRLADAHATVTSRKSLEDDIQRLEDDHAEEIVVLRSQLDESFGQVEMLRSQLNAAAESIHELESDVKTSAQRYETAQVEIRGLEHALNNTRAQLDEHDSSIQALQREKTWLQGEHTRLEADLEKSITKYQYLEQHSRRSDQDIIKFKSEVDHLHAEAAKFDEAAQKAEVNLSLKTVQFEQKLAMMERELKKQQDHGHCQESAAGLKERNEYLEEMLRMKSVEIEENDDRFIDALKEKKRLNGKIESLTRKVQGLQAKLATVTTQPPSTTPRPNTPSPRLPPVLQSMPSAGSSIRASIRIPSSPAAAFRARTPEPSRSQFAFRLATQEPPVPALPQNFKVKTPERPVVPRSASRVEQSRAAPSASLVMPPNAPSTPLSSGSRKRRAPDDFDPPLPIPTQAIVAPTISLTPRHARHPTNESHGRFTPMRSGHPAPMRPALRQPSPIRRLTAPPLSETTNSPREGRTLGLGKPAAATKAPMRSWLSRSRPPAGGAIDIRYASAVGARP